MTFPGQPAAEGEARVSGRVFGRYLILDEIASGGMATVHLAHARGETDRFVAVKCMHAHYARDPDFVSMFLDEATLCRRIRHENVVATIDVTQDHDELLLVLELVDGESLSKLVKSLSARRAKVPQPIASAVVCDMLRGLHAAHEAKNEAGEPLMIVHRDVSPHNVLVGTDGVARVLDFGVAKARGRVQQTQKGQLKGKLAYMSPEQARGRTVDRRSDLFSAGIVLWELLTGARLFEGENEAALLVALLSDQPAPPSKRDPSLARFDSLLLKALAVDPETRFPTALAMAAAVEAEIRPATRAEVATWVKAEARAALARRRELIEKARRQVATRTDAAPAPSVAVPAKAAAPTAAPKPASASAAAPATQPAASTSADDDGDRDSSPTAIAAELPPARPSERGTSAPRMLGGPAVPRAAAGIAPLPPVVAPPPSPSNRGALAASPPPASRPGALSPAAPAASPDPPGLWETATTTNDSPQTLALPAEANPFRAPDPPDVAPAPEASAPVVAAPLGGAPVAAASLPAAPSSSPLGPLAPPAAQQGPGAGAPAAHHDLTVPLFQSPFLQNGELRVPGLAPPPAPPPAAPYLAPASSPQPPSTAEGIPSQVTSVTLTTTDLPPPLPKEHVRRLTMLGAASAVVGAIAAVSFLVIVTRKDPEPAKAAAPDASEAPAERRPTATATGTAATQTPQPPPSADTQLATESAASAEPTTTGSASAAPAASSIASVPKPTGPRPHGFLNRPPAPPPKPKPTTTTYKPKR